MGITRRLTTEISEEEKASFETVWKIYPRKVDKQKALKRYCKLLKELPQEIILQAVKNLIDDKEGVEMQFIPQGFNFFGERYVDYLPQNYIKKTTKTPIRKVETVTVFKYEFKGYEDYLKTMMTIPYKDYLQTEHWIHFKKEAIKFFGHKCQLCNTNTHEIHIHHKTYENRGRETFNDVIPLCDGCHRLVHNK